jgi:DNA-binding response OmpR family regulator
MKKILIMEDDSIIANIYGNKFAMAGFTVQTAADGEVGLQLLKTFKPDLVQLDLMMPKINGVEVIKHIRSQPELESLPIIVLSNFYITNLVQEAWKAGANKCMTKANCTPNAMLEIVNELLTASSQSPACVPTPVAAVAASTTAPASSPVGFQETAVDTTFQVEIRRAFLQRAPQLLVVLRRQLQALTKGENHAMHMPALYELCRTVHSLVGNAGVAGFDKVADMASALEALLKELYEKPKHITVSSLRTVAFTLDFLSALFEQAAAPGTKTPAPAIVLVVDDEIISRQAIVLALTKANLGSISVDDPQIALKLLQENHFSLIFLDVEMPGLNGFELCSKLRALPACHTTPVVFVTSLTDFESRARSALSGGNDLIAKPFLLMELAVKALTYVLKQQIQPETPTAKMITP